MDTMQLDTETAPSGLVKVDIELGTVVYKGKGNHSLDFGMVRTDIPIFRRHKDLFYFEITVTNHGLRGYWFWVKCAAGNLITEYFYAGQQDDHHWFDS